MFQKREGKGSEDENIANYKCSYFASVRVSERKRSKRSNSFEKTIAFYLS